MSIGPLWQSGPCPWPEIDGECRWFEIQRDTSCRPGADPVLIRMRYDVVAWRQDDSGTAYVRISDICRKPDSSWWRIGCEHRHVEERMFCPLHVGVILEHNRAPLACSLCGHRCKVMVHPGRVPVPPGRASLTAPSPDPVPGMEAWDDPALSA